MNYRTPAEPPRTGRVLLERRSRTRPWIVPIALVCGGLTLFGGASWFGIRIHCQRSGPDDVGECTAFDVALADYQRFPARSGDVRAMPLESDDSVHVALFVRNHHSGPVSEDAATEAAAGYEAFVADRSARDFRRRVGGWPWFFLVFAATFAAPVTMHRKSPRGRRVVVDEEGDELRVEEVDARFVVAVTGRHRLSSLGTTKIESVDDSDAYDLFAEAPGAPRAIYRGTREDCEEVQRLVDPAIAKARELQGAR